MKDKEKKELELARRTPEFSPFSMMRRFTKDMERLFADFGEFNFPAFVNRSTLPLPPEFKEFDWMPKIEVLKSNGNLMVKADLPGMNKEEVKVEIREKALTISGERKEEKEERTADFYRTERSYGKFFRQIMLPEGVETENASANFINGVLEVKIPVGKAEPMTRKLEINGSPEKVIKATA